MGKRMGRLLVLGLVVLAVAMLTAQLGGACGDPVPGAELPCKG